MKSSIQRTEIILPQVKGYNIYKGDFHIHTNYSDGTVNPAGRVTEAWLDGLDIIAITDHYENHVGVKKFLKITAAYNEDGVATPYQNPSKVGSVKVDFNAIHDEAVKKVEKQVNKKMRVAAAELNFELAAEYRDKLIDTYRYEYFEMRGGAYLDADVNDGITFIQNKDEKNYNYVTGEELM